MAHSFFSLPELAFFREIPATREIFDKQTFYALVDIFLTLFVSTFMVSYSTVPLCDLTFNAFPSYCKYLIFYLRNSFFYRNDKATPMTVSPRNRNK